MIFHPLKVTRRSFILKNGIVHSHAYSALLLKRMCLLLLCVSVHHYVMLRDPGPFISRSRSVYFSSMPLLSFTCARNRTRYRRQGGERHRHWPQGTRRGGSERRLQPSAVTALVSSSLGWECGERLLTTVSSRQSWWP